MADISTVTELEDELLRPSPVPQAPHLFVLLNCSAPLLPSSRHSLAGLDEVLLGRSGLDAERSSRDDGVRRLRLRFTDTRMSAQHGRLRRSGSAWLIEDQGSKNGIRVNGQALDREAVRLEDGDLFELGRTFFLFRAALRAGPLDVWAGPETRTLLPELEQEYETLRKLASAGKTVMIHGEPGVGKDLLAQDAHAFSGRRGRFVPVDCGAISTQLFKSHFFGHRKGAFTDAHEDRDGVMKQADHGTLFLDEVGELPLESQASLLRVLQDRVVQPVGGTPFHADFLLVTATNRDLAAMVAQQKFRRDLWDRLGGEAGYSLAWPALRDRLEDFGLMVGTLLRRHQAQGLTFAPEAVRALLRCEWRDNVRGLEKVLERLAVLVTDQPVALTDLPGHIARPTDTPRLPPEELARRGQLVELLERHHGNVAAVARDMNRERMQIWRWMRRFRIDPADYRQRKRPDGGGDEDRGAV